MTRGDLSATGILNALVPHLRRIAAPAAGVLALTALPLRFLQIHFLDLLGRLGNEAPHYGNLLMAMSILLVAAYILSLYGRMVFIRACNHAPSSWRDLLRVDGRAFLTYLYLSLIITITLILFSITFIAIPFAILLAGIAAAATVDPPRIGLTAPLRAVSPYLGHGGVLAGLMFVFAIAIVVTMVNVYFLAQLMIWAASALPGVDPVRWLAATFASTRFRLAIVATAVTIVEPFFLTAMHVYADRVRSRKSGEDLVKRFDALTASKKVAAAIAVSLFVCMPLHAQDERTISQTEYRNQLTAIRDGLARGNFSDAESRSNEVDHVASITSTSGADFEPDRPLLHAASEAAGKRKADVVIIDRLTATIDALRAPLSEKPARIEDRQLLQRIEAQQKMPELVRGGELDELPEANTTLVDTVSRLFRRFIDWAAKKFEKFFDWLEKLWPKPKDDEKKEDAFFGVPVVVWIVTSFIVATLLLVMIYVLRRSKRRVVPVLSEQLAASERDADPLSRESNEWERYARELAETGRLREAIRAWYHAVLVTLYRAGVLHYRKGVTNWEYVSALSPALAWRPHFVSMTRQFDREWYGRRDTSVDALDSCAADARAILDSLRQGGR